MMHDDLFTRSIDKGQMIRPFLVAGVLEKEYAGERTAPGFSDCLEQAMGAADAAFGKDPAYQELDSFSLCGIEGQWRFCNEPAPQYADGHYYVMEHLGLMPVYCLLRSDRAQEVTLRIRAKRLCVWQDGKIVFDNEDFARRKTERVYVFEHAVKPNEEIVTLHLHPGENRILALQGVVGRGTGMSFCMELLSCAAPVTAGIPLQMDPADRAVIAHSQLETYMRDDTWKLGETPAVHIGRLPLETCDVHLRLSCGERVLFEELSASEVWTDLPQDLAPNTGREEYLLEVTWKLKDGRLLSRQPLSFRVVETLAPLPGFENFPQRRQRSLEILAEKNDILALYRLEQYDRITLDLIGPMCEKIERRADCADFDLLPLLWTVWEDQAPRHLSEEIHARIQHAAVGFRYWVDEPGTSSMFYCSENHRIGFHVCEYLAGLLYPTELFTNCEQNGMYHSLKGRMHLMEWLEQRCRVGFDEPHSDSYLPVTLAALLVLREVLPMEEYPLRNMVNVLLDFLTYIFAVSSFDGVMATPRGRSYNRPLRTGLASHIGGVFWAYFGNAEVSRDSLLPEFAFSFYVPPKGLCELAEDFTPATYFFKEGIMHFDKHNADFTIRRTPQYMLGGVRDHNVGMCDMHFISAMIALRGDAMIFFSAPNTVAEGGGLRPDYWAGQAALPRVLTAGRTLAVIWHNVEDPSIWMTHCHLNPRMFDEVVTRDGFTFGRKGEGYVGIYSTVPHHFSTEGLYAGRELVAEGSEVIWLAECGSQEEDGSFEAFMDRLANAARWQDERGYHFDSPGSGLFEFGLEEGFHVDKQEVPVQDYLCLSPTLRARYGSGRFEYHVPGFEVTQWTYPCSE